MQAGRQTHTKVAILHIHPGSEVKIPNKTGINM